MATRPIDTNLGVNANLTSISQTMSVGNVQGENIVGKSNLDRLSEAFSQINPIIGKLADKAFKDRNEADVERGKAIINGMSVEEAEQAHKNGLPDVYNGWVRYGANTQYAENATDMFHRQFVETYKNSRNEQGYNWEEDYKKQSQEFLKGKEGNPFFDKAFNATSSAMRKLINTKEFEFQSDELRSKVQANTMYSISSLSSKVTDRLEVDAQASLFAYDDFQKLKASDYAKEKQDYMAKNASKVWDEEFAKIKQSKNPALTKADFDELVIDAASEHAKYNGTMSAFFLKELMSVRPDGTPPIMSNPKLKAKADAAIKELQKTNLAVDFGYKFSTGNATAISDKDFNEQSRDLWNLEINRAKATGATTNAQAAEVALTNLSNGIGVNRPIPAIQEILQAPIGRDLTEGNKLALTVYQKLDSLGVAGIYFNAADKNSRKWFMINEFIKNGADPQQTLIRVGRAEANILKFTPLEGEERTTLYGKLENKNDASSRELISGIASYFKNFEGSGDHINLAGKYLEDNYTLVGGRYISKNTLANLGVSGENYANEGKSIVYSLIKEKYGEKQVNDLGWEFNVENTFGFDDDGQERTLFPPKTYSKNDVNTKIDLGSFDMMINEKEQMIYFVDRKFDYTDLPIVITNDKTGREEFLQIPISKFKAENERIQKVMAQEAVVRNRKEAERKKQAREEFKQQTELGLLSGS